MMNIEPQKELKEEDREIIILLGILIREEIKINWLMKSKEF